MAFAVTLDFENEVLRRRVDSRREWCIRVSEHPVRVERQEDNRWRFWAPIAELDGPSLRAITLEDRSTIHNAFSDRGFQAMKLDYHRDTDSLYIDLSEQTSV